MNNCLNRQCEYCKKPLKQIGIQRKNGSASFFDWVNRKYHKSCYVIVSKELHTKRMIEKIYLKFNPIDNCYDIISNK